MKHNDYIFSVGEGSFKFPRQFEEMYRNCENPHGQSHLPLTLDYEFASSVLDRLAHSLRNEVRPVRILDVGCGLGYFTAHLKRLLPRVEIAGCDISSTAVAKATVVAPDCQFFSADLRNRSSFPDLTYELIVAMDVLYYFTEEEVEGVVRNLRSLLEPSGSLFVGYHLPKTMSFGRYIRSLDDARALFESHNFTFRLALDVTNTLDKNYAGDPLGRHIYFVVQKG